LPNKGLIIDSYTDLFTATVFRLKKQRISKVGNLVYIYLRDFCIKIDALIIYCSHFLHLSVYITMICAGPTRVMSNKK